MSVKEHEPHLISRGVPSNSCWINAKPKPYNLLASVNRVAGNWGSKGLTTGGLHNNSLTFSNSVLWVDVQLNWVSLRKSCLMCAVFGAKSGMYDANWFARPRNDLTCVRFCGVGKSWMAAKVCGSGLIPWLVTKEPAKGIEVPRENFALLHFNPCSLNFCKTPFSLKTNSAKVGASTAMSSTILMHWQPCIALSVTWQNESPVAHNPIGPLQ